MRCRQLLPILALVTPGAPARDAAIGPCEKHQKPFQVSAESVAATVHTIAITSIQSHVELSDSARGRSALLDSLLSRALRSAQFHLIEATTTDSVWSALKDSIGGIYDVSTGQLDTAKAQAASDLFRQTLVDSFQVDAVLHPGLYAVKANFENGTAQWDGTKQGYANFGKRFMEGLAGGPYKGQTTALSLRTFIEATDGRPLYDNWGGIQILAVPQNGKFVTVPADSLLADSSRLAKAVQIAMCQLVRQR